MHSTPRRWFTFRLRTLFVVVGFLAVVLAWIEIQVNWIRERRAFINEQQFVAWPRRVGVIRAYSAPFTLRLFGESAIGLLIIPADTHPLSIVRMRTLFPEASSGTGNVISPEPEPSQFDNHEVRFWATFPMFPELEKH